MLQLFSDKDEDEEEGKIVVSSKAEQKPLITPKWPNRVFAMESIRLMLQVCKTFKEHVDLSHARKFKENSNGKATSCYPFMYNVEKWPIKHFWLFYALCMKVQQSFIPQQTITFSLSTGTLMLMKDYAAENV